MIAFSGTTQYVLFATSVPDTPANDNVAAAQAMGLGETVRTQFCGATNDGTSTCAPGKRDVWFSYTSAGCDQTIQLISSLFVTSSFAVYDTSDQEIECQDNPWGFSIPGFGLDFPAMTWAQPANTTYTIRASSDAADALTFAITEFAITDSDGDDVCDQLDICQGDDATGDTDSDGVCDDIDPCPIDNPDDADNDGVCDNSDNCPLDSNLNQADNDGDGVGNACDVCPGSNDNVDTDSDTIPDGCDACAGGATSGDTDANGAIDLGDHDDFEACLLGPDGGLGTGCECFDFDDDGDVDIVDYASIQRSFTGP